MKKRAAEQEAEEEENVKEILVEPKEVKAESG